MKKFMVVKDLSLGECLYLDNCVVCYFVNGKGVLGIFLVFDGVIVVNVDNFSVLLYVILVGVCMLFIEKVLLILVMLGFVYCFLDKEVVELVSFVC